MQTRMATAMAQAETRKGEFQKVNKMPPAHDSTIEEQQPEHGF